MRTIPYTSATIPKQSILLPHLLDFVVLLVDAFDSVKVALKALPALVAPAAACNATVLPLVTSTSTSSTKRVRLRIIVLSSVAATRCGRGDDPAPAL